MNKLIRSLCLAACCAVLASAAYAWHQPVKNLASQIFVFPANKDVFPGKGPEDGPKWMPDVEVHIQLDPDGWGLTESDVRRTNALTHVQLVTAGQTIDLPPKCFKGLRWPVDMVQVIKNNFERRFFDNEPIYKGPYFVVDVYLATQHILDEKRKIVWVNVPVIVPEKGREITCERREDLSVW